MSNVYTKFEQITTIILDVDGVLTDGSVLAMANGEQLRTFDIKDGWAIHHAIKVGFRVIIISAGNGGEGVQKRLEHLGIQHIHLTAKRKLDVFNEYVEKFNLTMEEILYMGDDMPDYEILQKVGLSTCPSDASNEILSLCQYVSPKRGGKGAVRDVIEKILKLQGKFPTYD